MQKCLRIWHRVGTLTVLQYLVREDTCGICDIEESRVMIYIGFVTFAIKRHIVGVVLKLCLLPVRIPCILYPPVSVWSFEFIVFQLQVCSRVCTHPQSLYGV